MKKLLLSVLVLVAIVGFTYSQAAKRVLFENWTSSTCPPCASNNPQLHSWMNGVWANGLVAVAYHVGWPSPGNDPMYLHNPTQSYDRRYYYGINAVPAAYMQGIHYYVGSPFPFGNMTTYFNMYITQTAPTSVNVVDTRIANGDSNRVNITVTNLSALPSGTYNLRVMVIEHAIQYGSPPGTNGETFFPNVFRLSVPNSTGTSIPLAAGTYNFEFRYKINAVWNDAQIYTMAFIQNDVDKTILNAGRNGLLTGINDPNGTIPSSYTLSQNYPNPFNPVTNIKFEIPKNEYVSLKLYDMLGNEVQKLVDGNQQAGVYNITVDGTNLSSGVYFYTLRTNNFIETKKMMLVK
jgi:hypothetical protein